VGTSTIFDIVTSTVIGGMLLLMALRLNAQAIETNAIYQDNLNLQEGLVALVDIVEYDFRKIGYCSDFTKISPPNTSIVSADSNSIKFLTDIPSNPNDMGDGIVDTVYYYLGNVSMNPNNPRERYLYRVVNGQATKGWSLGVTRFALQYFDALGDTIPFPVSDPKLIYTLEVNLSLESPAPLTAIQYHDSLAAQEDFKVYWKQIRLASRNLRNR
jgi:type II secretory pathway component PulJ